MKPIFAKTCVGGWLEAIQHLQHQTSWRDYNVILEIAQPMSLPAEDKRVSERLDRFLVEKAASSVQTVINTIFPSNLYRQSPGTGIFAEYERIWPSLEQNGRDTPAWGTYFRRMTNRGSGGKTINPLEMLVKKIKKEARSSNPKHACYEMGVTDPFFDLAVSEPLVDATYIMRSPCLSHLSFKIDSERRLLLTAFYRSHYYLGRALGNFFGLAWLQHFVAKEAGVTPGVLVCHSSMATIDTPQQWTRKEAVELILDCQKANTGSEFH